MQHGAQFNLGLAVVGLNCLLIDSPLICTHCVLRKVRRVRLILPLVYKCQDKRAQSMLLEATAFADRSSAQ